MLSVTLVLCALVGVSFADFECCTAENRQEVQHLWSDIWSAQFAGRRIQVAQAIFEDLFERDPDAKKLFTSVNVANPDSPEFLAHCIRVVNGLDTVIGLFDDTKTLKSHLEHLGHQHAARTGIRKEHFQVISRSFAKVIPQVSGCFNLEAWDGCFAGVANKISSYLES